jgi:hypothetical protein
MPTALAPYTLAQIKTDTQFLTGDVDGTRFSPARLTEAANWAVKTLVTRMGYTYIESQVAIKSSDSVFPHGSYFPITSEMDYLEIRRVFLASGQGTSTYPLLSTTLPLEDANYPWWRSRVGIPERWALFNGSSIAVFPLPDTSQTWTCTIGYVQQPQLLSADGDTVDARVPFSVQPYLKYAAANWLLSLDQSDTTSLQTAKLYMDTFYDMINGGINASG